MGSPIDQCSTHAREFSSRISKVDNAELRGDLRDTYEYHCEKHEHYFGTDTYNIFAEQRAMKYMEPVLKKYGL